MIDIYDEVGYIRQVLEHGLSDKWERDAILLIRFYKLKGMKKSEVKQIIKQKCESYVVKYNPLIHYKLVDKIIDTAWKKEVPLRQINRIEFTQEVLDWFINLQDSFTLTPEQLEYEQNRRPKVKITDHPMTVSRIKFLFTLFVWTKIQEHYLDAPNMHYLNSCMKKFKHDAALPSGFSYQNEKNLLYDFGFIYVNMQQGVDAKFMKNEVFSVPITDKNRVVMKGNELYDCGKWIEEKILGTFKCKNCGAVVSVKDRGELEGLKRVGKNRCLCEECAKKHNPQRYKKIDVVGGLKLRKCAGCGCKFDVDSIKNKDGKVISSKYCLACRVKRRQEQKAKYYASHK